MFSLKTLKSAALTTVLAAGAGIFALAQNVEPETRTSYIVQGESLDTVLSAVGKLDAEVTHELGVIRAVAANLTEDEAERLRDLPVIRRIYGNSAVEAAGKPDKGGSGGGSGGSGGDDGSSGNGGSRDTFYASLIDADLLHQQGIDGWGVGIAIIDTGMWSDAGLTTSRYGNLRRKVAYDAITDTVSTFKNTNGASVYDKSGHGSHVASIAVSSREVGGVYNGIAPGANVIAVTALDENGQGTYADVIRALDWLVANKNRHGVDIINMSLSAPAVSHYWEDPINQAVMAAWQAGIVVIASAGNTGPGAQTIGVPGNVPYVITVGAMTDNYTPEDGSDDRLASFSSVGPTYEGFVKPEVVAPGGHMTGLMQKSANLATQHSLYHDGDKYFSMSGTSQATAIVSGVAALVLQMEPGITPDMVKCKIMSAARPALNADATLAYSVFQQGAGVVNAYDATYNWNYDCANNGLDINADVEGTQHFGGRANQDADGNYYLMGLDGYLWTDRGVSPGNANLWSDGYLWRDGYLWADGYLWTDGRISLDAYLWSDGFLWSSAYLWRNSTLTANGFLWSAGMTEAMSINTWVDQE